MSYHPEEIINSPAIHRDVVHQARVIEAAIHCQSGQLLANPVAAQAMQQTIDAHMDRLIRKLMR